MSFLLRREGQERNGDQNSSDKGNKKKHSDSLVILTIRING